MGELKGQRSEGEGPGVSLTKWLVKPLFSSMSAMLAETATSSGSCSKSLREVGGEEPRSSPCSVRWARGASGGVRSEPGVASVPRSTPFPGQADSRPGVQGEGSGTGHGFWPAAAQRATLRLHDRPGAAHPAPPCARPCSPPGSQSKVTHAPQRERQLCPGRGTGAEEVTFEPDREGPGIHQEGPEGRVLDREQPEEWAQVNGGWSLM